MKALYLANHGGPEQLKFGDLESPNIEKGQVLVQVRACALNHLDILVRNGIPAYPVKFPHILGSDISGEIKEINLEAKKQLESLNLKIGSQVVIAPGLSCGSCIECARGHDNQCDSAKIIGAAAKGGYAEFCVVPAKNVFPKPSHLSFEEAASFPLTFLTAWHMLVTRAQLKQGEKVLVVGAGSGVGSAAIQIVKIFHGIVIAASSSLEKLELAKELGADFTIHIEKEDVFKKVREISDHQGVNIVFEHVGPATWEQSFKSLARCGRIVTCGSTTGPIVPLDLRALFSKDISILGSKLGTLQEFNKILQLMEEKKLKPVISKIFPLREGHLAHEFLEKREQFGKVVLKI
ncbi:MAG: zinc-binding dehydrogenase [Elusimicrobia bacterium]|nr:zinc-binding dehydrogenase [Elusimicrobiota bacterium]